MSAVQGPLRRLTLTEQNTPQRDFRGQERQLQQEEDPPAARDVQNRHAHANQETCMGPAIRLRFLARFRA